jgi:hypothetical protein
MKKIYIIIMLMIFVMVFIAGLSYTYYLHEKDYDLNLNTKSYEVYSTVSFDGVVYDHLSEYYDQEKKAFIINVYDQNATNYIEKLSIDLQFEVPIASKMRFQIKESYELTRYYHNQEETIIKEIIYQQTIDPTYFNHSLLSKGSFQNYFNHSDLYTYAYETFYPDSVYQLNIVSGGNQHVVRNNSLYHETCYLYLDYSFEFVQANRYSNVWQIDPLLFS